MPSWLVRQLRSIDGLDAELDEDVLQLSMSGGSPVSFVVEEKSRLSMEGARGLAALVEDESSRILVATRKLADEARSVLKNSGISWVERDTDACRIQGPGILVERSPAVPDTKDMSSEARRPATKLRGKAGVIAETLLFFFQEDDITVRDLADRAGASVGYTSRVLKRLENEAVLISEGAHAHKRRQISDSAGLLDLWRDEEKTDSWTRRSLYVWSQTPDALYSRLLDLTEAGIRWALGHTSAADRYAPTLTRTPDPDVWVRAAVPVTEVAEVLDGELVERGSNVTVWQSADDSPLYHAGREEAEGDSDYPMVSRYRAYVEAYHRGGRSEDVATRLREALALFQSRPSP